MLERRAGEDNFKRILERAVFAACHPKAAGLPDMRHWVAWEHTTANITHWAHMCSS